MSVVMESFVMEYLKNMLNGNQQELIDKICEDYNLDNEELNRKYIIPIEIKVNISQSRQVSKSGIDWRVVVSKTELKKFKLPELKAICSDHDLLITGNKSILMDRVWGINHPDEAPKEVRKRRGRPPKNKTQVDVMEQKSGPDEDCQLDPEKMPDIFINNDGEISDSEKEGFTVYKLIEGTRFVFFESADNFEYSGEIIDGKFVKNTTDGHPEDLLKILGLE